MASKEKTIRNTDSARPGKAIAERERTASEQEIRERAYEIYLQRGAQPGSEFEDWLQAKAELTSANSRHSV